MFRRAVSVFLAYPALCNALAVGLFLLAAYCARNVRFDSDVREFFAVDSEAKRRLDLHQSEFGTDETVGVVLLHGSGPELVDVVDTVSERLAQLPMIERVQSATTVPLLVSDDGAIGATPAFGRSSTLSSSFEQRVAALRSASVGGDRLVSKDGRRFGILVWLDQSCDRVELSRAPLRDIQRVTDAAVREVRAPIRVAYGGVPFTRVTAVEAMQRDLMRLTPLMVLVSAGLLFWQFRRAAAVVLPFSVVALGTAAAIALLGVRDKPLNMLTSVLPVLLMAIGIADSVHLLHRFYEERRAGSPPREAALTAGIRVGAACLFASMTTAVGFVALLTTRLHILHDFGLVAGFGVLCAFLAMLPLLTVNLGQRDDPPPPLWFPLRDSVLRISRAVLPARVALWIVIGAAVLGLASVYVGARSTINHYLAGLLPTGNAVRAANGDIDAHMGGVIPIEIAFAGEPGSMRRHEVLARLAALARDLREEHGVHGLLATASVIEDLHEKVAGVRSVPANQEAVAQLFLLLENSRGFTDVRLTNADASRARFIGSLPDIGAVAFERVRQRIDASIARRLEGTGVSAYVTGVATVAYASLNSLAAELVYGELLAAGVIVVMIGFTLRNGWLILISIGPNVLPLLLGLAWFGASGQHLDPGPAMVFVITSGIVVDDTVHLLSRYREELDAGRTQADAILTSVGEVGGAAISTSVIIIAGFLLIATSSFPANRTFGLLGAAILSVGVVIDVVLLPALLSLVDRSPPALRARRMAAAPTQTATASAVGGAAPVAVQPAELVD
jgi:predicted RND superfamily exporter protein